MTVNKAMLVGRLGRDPETRYISSGQAVCNFNLATDETYKDKNGERQKRTEWHRIVVWGKMAEIAQQYLKKGSQIYLEGRIQTREWEKDGQKRYSTEIVATSFKFLGGRGEGGPGGTSSGGGGRSSGFSSGETGSQDVSGGSDEFGGAGAEPTEEDIPF
jgi:single-strand DNA-binding protein